MSSSDDQEQAPMDWLADGERLLARYKSEWNANDGYTKEMRDAEDALHMWLELNGRALVTGFKAAQKQYQIACDLVEQVEAERDAAHEVQTNLAKDVLALSEQLSNEQSLVELARLEHNGFVTTIEQLQARIAELEGCLRPFAWYADMLDKGEVLGIEHKELMAARDVLAKAQTPAAS